MVSGGTFTVLPDTVLFFMSVCTYKRPFTDAQPRDLSLFLWGLGKAPQQAFRTGYDRSTACSR